MKEILIIAGALLMAFGAFTLGMEKQRHKPQRVWVHFESVNSKKPNGMEFSDYLRDGKMEFQIEDSGLKCTVNVLTYEP